MFSRESLETFICHCSWVKGRCNLYKYFGGQGSEAWSWQNCCFGGGGPDGAPPRWGPQGTSKGVKKWRLANLATLGTNMYILFFKAFSKMTFRLSGARNVSVPRRVNCHQLSSLSPSLGVVHDRWKIHEGKKMVFYQIPIKHPCFLYANFKSYMDKNLSNLIYFDNKKTLGRVGKDERKNLSAKSVAHLVVHDSLTTL